MACDVVTTNAPLNLNVIGPRSVIVPADPIIWDEGTSYEYLTLVASTDFGQGYVSKKDVPSGTPLTNTEYWIPVASFNAQLSQLQTDMASNSTKLEQETTAREVADTQLQSSIDNINAHDIVCMGDSLASGIINDGSSPNSQYGWLNFVQTHKPTGVDTVYTNTSTVIAGNTGFTSSRTFLAVITDMVENVITNKNNVKHVYVSGGTNDYAAGNGAVASAITTFCNYVKQHLPNAEITIMYQASNHWEAYYGYRQGASDNGCRFESTGFVMQLPGYLTDGTHLTDAGYQATLPFVYNSLFYGASNGSLGASYNFDTADLGEGVTANSNYAGIQYVTTPTVYTAFMRITNAPTPLIFSKSSYTGTAPLPIIKNANKYILANNRNFFIPVVVQADDVAPANVMLYYDISSNTLSIPATNSGFNGKSITITVTSTLVANLD